MVAYLDEGGARYLVKKVLDRIQPVGSLYFSTTSTSPASLFGGTWERYAQGRVMVSASDTDTDFTVGKTGGEKTHQHGLINDAYAMISWDTSGGVALSRRAASSWKSNARVSNVFLPLATDAGTRGQGIDLGGNTNNASSSMPYIAVYIWRRTA